jgi:DNA-binding NarL/FixJ family response regulator
VEALLFYVVDIPLTAEFIRSRVGTEGSRAAKGKAGAFMSSVRVFVVEDYAPFRRFLISQLQTRPELQVIGEASDGLEAVHKAEELKPDLILLDIGLPSLNGIEAARRISRVLPDAKILFVSQDNDPDVAAVALSGGAKGYVHKLDVTKDLLPAVQAVLRGEHFSSAGIRLCREESLHSDSPSI